ncbi:MAG: lysoplasmalogenase [Rhodobacterales bacterium]|nr:MAG: lysoplasmalogenase [Rhodobacterales bacterium]
MIAMGASAWYGLRWCAQPASWAKTWVKTAAVVPLVLLAVFAGGPVALILALALCALGDYLLSRDREAQFIAGVAAFAAGHVAYVVLFLTHPLGDVSHILRQPNIPVIAALVGLGAVMLPVLWRHAGDLRIPVMIYVPVILSMGVTVLALPELTLAHWAAALFILSDFTLAMDMFVLRDDTRAKRLAPFVVWPTYWGAQFLFLVVFSAISQLPVAAMVVQ